MVEDTRKGWAAAKSLEQAVNLTEGPITKTLLVFALPTLGSNILQSLNGSINAIWVGQLVGEAGLAATSNANLILFMIFSLVFGFGMAATILVGQSMGRRDIAGVRRSVGAGTSLFLVLGICAAAGGWIATPYLLNLLGTPKEVFHLALPYLQVMFAGLPPSLIMILLTMSLRGTGDSMTPFLFMLPGTLIDVALNPVLILGLGPAPEMGIAGAAMASLIANYCSLAALILYIYARDLPIRLRRDEFAYFLPSRELVGVIVRKGAPMGLQMIVMSGSALVMIGLVNREGTSTVAAYGAVNQLWTYIQMPAIAIGTAVSAMAAQNIGAGQWNRVGQIARAGVVMNLALTGSMVAVLALADHLVLGLFLGSDSQAIAIADHINLVAGWSFILFGITMVLSGVTRANGATLAPLVIMALALLPGRLGAIFFLFRWLEADAIWWSFPVGSAVSTLLTVAYYRYGRWRDYKITVPAAQELEEFEHSEAEPAGRVHPTG